MGRILNADTLTDHGLVEGRLLMLDILEHGLRAADPYYATKALLRREGDILTVGGDAYAPPGTPLPGPAVIDLSKINRIYCLGGGKGIQGCAKAIEELLGDRLTGGVVIDKHGTPLILERVQVVYGAHPIPDEGCAEGCRRIVEIAKTLGPDDLVFTMTGNGVGSLLTLPAPGITVEDIRQVVYMFQIERGGPTGDLVPIRNHLDSIKGGQFTRYLKNAQVIHLINFNRPKSYHQMVYGTPYRWMHLLPDSSTFADAVASLKKWDLWERVPQAVRDRLLAADPAGETLKGDEFERLGNKVFFIFSRETGVVVTAKRRAEELGLRTRVLFNNYDMQAEASQVGRVVANLAKHSEYDGDPFEPPLALLSGGELLVTVGTETGMGGRDQEYITSAALQIAGTQNIVMASVDSDGTDGPGHQFVGPEYAQIPVLTGGIVDGQTALRAKELGINLVDALKRHDTSPALWALGDGVVTLPAMSMGDLSVTIILGRSTPKA
jgi:glycerate-2-kinase